MGGDLSNEDGPETADDDNHTISNVHHTKVPRWTTAHHHFPHGIFPICTYSTTATVPRIDRIYGSSCAYPVYFYPYHFLLSLSISKRRRAIVGRPTSFSLLSGSASFPRYFYHHIYPWWRIHYLYTFLSCLDFYHIISHTCSCSYILFLRPCLIPD